MSSVQTGLSAYVDETFKERVLTSLNSMKKVLDNTR